MPVCGIETPWAQVTPTSPKPVTLWGTVVKRVRPEEVVDWVADHVPENADAVFLGGNGFRAARAVGPLEERLDRLVLESNQVLLWGVNDSLGTPLAVRGFGRLLEPRREELP